MKTSDFLRLQNCSAPSPESSIEIEKAIGSDIIMALDHCISSTAPRAEAEANAALSPASPYFLENVLL